MKTPPRGRDISAQIQAAKLRDRTAADIAEDRMVEEALHELLARIRGAETCRHGNAYVKHDGPVQVGKKYPFFCPDCQKTFQP